MTQPSIAAVRWRPFRLPMRARFEAATGALESREGVLIEIVAADGLRGVGEASPLPALGAGTAEDALALLEAHGAALAQPSAADGLPDGPGVDALRCALDVAVLDLEGRTRGAPVAALLSEAHAPWVAANAIIGGGRPAEVARYGMQALEAGYSVLKVKVGVSSLEGDVERIRVLRQACPEATIRIDANGAWDEATARRALDALYPYRIELLEQPVPAEDVDALARIRQTAPTRIAADESVQRPEARERVIEQKAADLVVLKPMLLGGLRPALALAQRAAAAGIGAFATTTWDSSIGTAAAAHLAAALTADAAHGLGTGEHLAADVVERTLLPRAGRLALPAGPGLGITYDDAALDEVATGPWREVAV